MYLTGDEGFLHDCDDEHTAWVAVAVGQVTPASYYPHTFLQHGWDDPAECEARLTHLDDAEILGPWSCACCGETSASMLDWACETLIEEHMAEAEDNYAD
jgi:hypothetical protein